MRRCLTLITSLAFTLLLLGGTVTAQEEADTAAEETGGSVADGDFVVADSDNPEVEGSGEGLIYGDINTGGAGDGGLPVELIDFNPPPPTPPDLSEVPDPPAVSDPPPPADEEQEITATDDGVEETTTTTTETNDGETTETGDGTAPPPAPVDPLPPPAAAPTDPAPAVASCADYATWYDAQIAYEEAGALAADPALVTSLDPDNDGIACEEMMIV